jgi:polysaccharide deacetylase family protein (PEP-CTERM system associated)
MINVLTVDVEDWFHVQAFSELYPVETWDNQRTRILGNILKVLSILEDYNTTATFFVLGWVARKLPEMVALIAQHGHELASHSQWHRLVYNMTPEDFRKDLQESVLRIEDASGVSVRGYRAPSFSVRLEHDWVWKTMADSGIEYDSSVFPVRHDTYGNPRAPRFAYDVDLGDGGSILEIPPSTIKFMGANIPVAGGGYLRMFPYWFTRRGIQKINEEGHPAVVYFHPWELDTNQARARASLKSRFRHYTNIRTLEPKLRRLLADFRFTTISEVFLQKKDSTVGR